MLLPTCCVAGLTVALCLCVTADAAQPAAFFLAGDSTTATQTYPDQGGGWGDGFINTTLENGAIGKNYGHDGATTVTFRTGGYWANVIAMVKNYANSNAPYVTIQFGHNDQKAANNISIAEFTTNLETFAKEVKAAGGTPIFVTPITRRSFASGSVVQNLAAMANATIAAADATDSDYIDLNKYSTVYVNAIGATDAATYNLVPTDFTHLNIHGSVLFGNMVSWLLDGIPGIGETLTAYTKPNATILGDIESGTYILPYAI